MTPKTRTQPKKDHITLKGVRCKKCGCKKFTAIGVSNENARCIHCGTFTFLWGA